ncbi:MAG: homoserine dehydrogenase [Brevinematia bacterium]
MARKIKIAIIGAGTIGGGLINILNKERETILKKTDIDIEIKYIIDKDAERLEKAVFSGAIKSKDYKDALKDKEVEIIVELVGGKDFAYSLIEEALKNNKNVVTANKALLAEKGLELFRLAEMLNKTIGFEASVCGGIPIIRTIYDALAGDKIEGIYGIVNGTTNYILTKMYEENISFSAALKEAQKLGFAEADPTLDISGIDAAHKIAILAQIAFNTEIEFDNVYVEGINKIELEDIKNADELGYILKLLAIAKLDPDNSVEVRVHPCLVSKENLLAFVRNEYNAVFIETEYFGNSIYYGKGAGANPTSTAILADIIDIAKNNQNSQSRTKLKHIFKLNVKDIGEIESRYYVRFLVPDRPGVLSKISGIFGENNISIASVIQKERSKETYVPLIMTTHTAKEKNLLNALNEIEKLDFSKKRGIMIRLIDD